MIPYRNRFHGHNSLKYVSKNGTSFRSQYITLKVSHNPKRSQNRMAVVVSKKVSKSAVSRNRMRRRLYEILRLAIPEIKAHHDIIIYIASSSVKTISSQELTLAVHQLMTQANIIEPMRNRDDIIKSKKVDL